MALFNWKKREAVQYEKSNSISGMPEHKLQSVEENTVRNGEDKEFDLNIEKILENWEVYHAVREIIANALDEQILTGTQDIQIIKKNNEWHIVDFGRGINYHHLTQNENEEKLNNDKLIGRFGVGLKDALATLYRHKIDVRITSKYGIITLMEASKTGFDDIVTLHAKIEETPNKTMIGTDFALIGCTDKDIEIAKSLFLKFSDSIVLETTNYGQVISKSGDSSYIYINGVRKHFMSNYTEDIGRQGVHKCGLIFAELGFIFREQTISDYGIDAIIETRNKDYLSGKMIAVQIKSGDSFFKEKEDDCIVFRGYIKHYNYWLNHSLPIIIVIYNPSTGECIWENVNKQTVQKCQNGWKIKLPCRHSLEC